MARGATSGWQTSGPCIERDLGITCGNRASLPYDPPSPILYEGKVCEERVNIFLHLYGMTLTLKLAGYLLCPGVRTHKQEGRHSLPRKTSKELQIFLLLWVKVLSITGWWLRLGSVLMYLTVANPWEKKFWCSCLLSLTQDRKPKKITDSRLRCWWLRRHEQMWGLFLFINIFLESDGNSVVFSLRACSCIYPFHLREQNSADVPNCLHLPPSLSICWMKQEVCNQYQLLILGP